MEHAHVKVQDTLTIPMGTVLMREGDKGNCAYLLLEGRMAVERNGKQGPVPLGEIEPVNIVGELAILNEVPRTATVITLTECRVIELNKHRLRMIIRRYPEIAEIVIKILCNRLMQATDKLTDTGPIRPAASEPAPKPTLPLPPEEKLHGHHRTPRARISFL